MSFRVPICKVKVKQLCKKWVWLEHGGPRTYKIRDAAEIQIFMMVRVVSDPKALKPQIDLDSAPR